MFAPAPKRAAGDKPPRYGRWGWCLSSMRLDDGVVPVVHEVGRWGGTPSVRQDDGVALAVQRFRAEPRLWPEGSGVARRPGSTDSGGGGRSVLLSRQSR